MQFNRNSFLKEQIVINFSGKIEFIVSQMGSHTHAVRGVFEF
jgi:hypothetical protein